jgi:hypothetical protein
VLQREWLVPTLRELQYAFAGALTGTGGVALGIPKTMTARLEIYANTRRGSLKQALGLTFPAVRALVGDEFFAAMAGDFVATTPPESAYLNDYGAQLARFLRSHAPAASIDYLADVAELEWAVSRACHAPDAPRLDPGQLSELDPADLARVIFIVHPAVAIVRLPSPADQIWRAVLEQDEAAMRAIDLTAGPVHLLVERDVDEQVQVRRLTRDAWQLTQRLLAGEPLYSALSPEPGAAAGTAPVAGSAQMTLTEHLSARRFVGCRLAMTQGEQAL